MMNKCKTKQLCNGALFTNPILSFIRQKEEETAKQEALTRYNKFCQNLSAV